MTASSLNAALVAAQRGWRVFPLVPDAKRPAVRGWEARATTDPGRIRRCWTAGPFGVGVACGPSGLLVVDLDMPKSGEHVGSPSATGADVLARLAAQHGQPYPDATYAVATGSGGRHLYFTAPTGRTWRNTAGRLGPLIDTRASGGYVVGAGSIVSGRAYRAVTDTDPAPLPDWLAALLEPPAVRPVPAAPVQLDTGRHSGYVAAAIRAEVARVRDEPDNHNGALYIAACALGQLVAGGALSEDDVRAVLLGAFVVHIAAEPRHHNQREAHNTISSGLKAGAKRPRKVAA